ncbi:MAG TPA: ABC transporter permease [Bryobacteraceae bacterium]|nr:ABC transporter permease [Bryobacteraceae bacterium]
MHQDISFAIRQLLRNRTFGVIAVVTLSLAIGANTAIFSAVDSVLLHPLPYPNSDQLVSVVKNFSRFSRVKVPISPPEVLDFRKMATCFSAQGAVDSLGTYTLTGNGEPEVVPLMHATASIFPMLGVKPLLGGFFGTEAEQLGNHHVAVISERLWQRRYGSDPAIIGRNIDINQESYRVVGVIAPILEYRLAADIWVPLAFSPRDLTPQLRAFQYVDFIGRLKKGRTLQQARLEFESIAARLRQQYPRQYEQSGFSLDVDPLKEKVAGDLRGPLLILMCAVGMMMLIACVNMSNLLLARGVTRRKEISIRAALGASRGRITRQLLIESILLVLIADAVGVFLAVSGLGLYGQFGPAGLISGARPALNVWVLAFSVVLSASASVLFGLAPALEASRADLNEPLKANSHGSTVGKLWLRQSLVTLEVALSLMLLIGAGLLTRSFARMEHTNPGFNANDVLTAELYLPVAEYRKPEQVRAFQEALLNRLGSLPGVTVAAAADDPMPFSGHFAGGDIEVVGRAAASNRPIPVVFQSRVTPDYFQAMGIPLVGGRYLIPEDNQESVRVAVIDKTLAERFIPHENPLGRHILTRDRLECTIVGVVGATKYRDLTAPPEPVIYLSAWQSPGASISLALRTAIDPLSVLPSVRTTVTALDPNVPVAHAATVNERLADSVRRQHFSIQLMVTFAAISALLAVVGIYGVLAYIVDQRRRELAIRSALGALASDLRGLVLRQGALPIGIGMALGIGGAIALSRVLKSFLYEVSPFDPAAFVTVSVALAAVALAAMVVPIYRATNVDPLEVLRSE